MIVLLVGEAGEEKNLQAVHREIQQAITLKTPEYRSQQAKQALVTNRMGLCTADLRME